MNKAPQTVIAQTAKAHRGSRERCLTFTDGTAAQVAARFTSLVAPHAHVDAERHQWMPKGHNQPAEAKLGECPLFLTTQQRAIVTDWWLAVKGGANTPNWDMVSQATIGEQEGLILVEAKAHENESKLDGKPQKSSASANSNLNHQRISDAISEANRGLNAIAPTWKLTHTSHYQLANRFAWSWRIASMGVPVILVYLGFLEADEMSDRGKPFERAAEWENHILAHAQGIVPTVAWLQELSVPSGNDTTPMRALIRTF